MTEKIHVLRRALEFTSPNPEEHRAFQDEAVCVRGTRQAVDESLDGILHQDHVEIGFPPSSKGEQAAMDSSGVVNGRRDAGHTRDSR